jgi:hypothetical protein
MKLPRTQLINWFPMMLTIAGGLSLLAGVFVAVFSMIVPANDQRSLNSPMHGTLYVGASTCYTCHSGDASNWSSSLYTQTIVDSVVEPEAVTNVNPREEVWRVNVSQLADAYTTQNHPAPIRNLYPQNYVVKTETGHTLLHDSWNTAASESEVTNPADSPFGCIGCHTTNMVRGRLDLEGQSM